MGMLPAAMTQRGRGASTSNCDSESRRLPALLATVERGGVKANDRQSAGARAYTSTRPSCPAGKSPLQTRFTSACRRAESRGVAHVPEHRRRRGCDWSLARHGSFCSCVAAAGNDPRSHQRAADSTTRPWVGGETVAFLANACAATRACAAKSNRCCASEHRGAPPRASAATKSCRRSASAAW